MESSRVSGEKPDAPLFEIAKRRRLQCIWTKRNSRLFRYFSIRFHGKSSSSSWNPDFNSISWNVLRPRSAVLKMCSAEQSRGLRGQSYGFRDSIKSDNMEKQCTVFSPRMILIPVWGASETLKLSYFPRKKRVTKRGETLFDRNRPVPFDHSIASDFGQFTLISNVKFSIKLTCV